MEGYRSVGKDTTKPDNLNLIPRTKWCKEKTKF